MDSTFFLLDRFWRYFGDHFGVESGPNSCPNWDKKLILKKSGPRKPCSAENRSWEGTFPQNAGCGVAVGVI